MMVQFVGKRTAAVPAGAALLHALLRHQRLSGAVGFARGLRNSGRRGKAVATRFVNDIVDGRTIAAGHLLRAGATITGGDGARVSTAELAKRLRGAATTRVIASGRTVVVSTESAQVRAVLFVEITAAPMTIGSVHCFFG
jgi:hypothetical protein